ncbi:MAG: Arc family DNA-binding protein [Pseudohongiellaceae bacterium]
MSNNLNTETAAADQKSSKQGSPALIEKFVIRLPHGLRTKIKQLSEQNRRSMNSEIIMVLEKHIHQSLMSSGLSELDLADFENAPEMTDKQLSEKLEALPPEKKEALLELLG